MRGKQGGNAQSKQVENGKFRMQTANKKVGKIVFPLEQHSTCSIEILQFQPISFWSEEMRGIV